MTEYQLYIFIAAMLGHFVGDYLLQNQYMAVDKSFPGWRGHIACTVHILLYTMAVLIFTGMLHNVGFILAVAIPHWIIDRWSLAKYWLRYKNGYHEDNIWDQAPVCAAPSPNQLQRNVWKIAFAAPVYIMNDNTLHWVCLWLTVKYMVR